ncbi:exonuclease domain-containing protein [Pseudomonas luteola]
MSKNRIIIDLEATCDDKRQLPVEEMEIIEIGACLVNENFEVLDEFQTLIRPQVHPKLDPFCTQLTHITQEMVDGAPCYDQAIAAFDAWVEKCDVQEWCSWGDYDRKQFERNAALLNREKPLVLSLIHTNIKQLYGQVVGVKRAPGVNKALGYEGLSFEGTLHRGLDDAKNIARLGKVAFGLTQSAWKNRPAIQIKSPSP